MKTNNLFEIYTEGDSVEKIVADLKRTGWIWNIKPTPSGVAHHITEFLLHDSDVNAAHCDHANRQQIQSKLADHEKVKEIASLLQKHQR